MTPAFIITTALFCAAAAWLLLALLLRTGMASHIALDHASARSLHQGTVPRVGGLILFGVALPTALVGAQGLNLIAGLTATLILLGWLDDRYGMPVVVRLIFHVLVATAAAVLLAPAAAPWHWLVLLLLLTWAMNLYNFMDGADGLAGGMALFGFGAYAAAAFLAESSALALLSACVAGAAAGFLLLNWAPARVFLGDAGSVPLGFLGGVIGIAGWRTEAWPIWFPLLVFSPFVVDATVTLVRRVLRGERPWKAHRQHLYQRMVRSGLGHGRTAALWYGAMVASSGSALAALWWPKAFQFGLLLAWTAVYATVFWLTRRLGIRIDQ
jgi:UDP-N-acetylmuramyl pentapeptide phosphotransferase/UDP-N-acetylglucosamine-1-phosphate transferase